MLSIPVILDLATNEIDGTENEMTAKIYEIKSGREIKGRALKALRGAVWDTEAFEVERRPYRGGKEIQKGDAERLLLALERRMARST